MRDASDNKEYVIFSGDTLLESALQFLHDNKIKFKTLVGKYKGVEEIAFIIESKDTDKIKPLVNKQESVLHLGELSERGRHATLIFKDGSKKDIGYFKKVSEKYARAQDAYTYDSLTGVYYVAEQDYVYREELMDGAL